MAPDAIAAMEARLLAVERRCVRLEDDTRTLARGVLRGQQGVWDAWADFRGRGTVVATAPTTPNTPFNGAVIGCTTGVLPASALTLQVAGGGAVLWTGSAPTGTYSGTTYLAANAAVELVIVPTSSHMATTTVTLGTMLAGATNAFPNAAATAASGFHCFVTCTTAFNSTVTVSDNHFADSTVLTWNGSTSWDGTAAAAPTRAYSLFPNGQLRCYWTLSPPQFIVPNRTLNTCNPRWTMPAGTAPTWAAGNTLDVADTP